MKKLEIQVPEELFTEISGFAQRREWSLAKTFRRGAELLLETYAEDSVPASQPWQPPTSRRVGWKGLTAGQLRDLAFEDQTRDPFAL